MDLAITRIDAGLSMKQAAEKIGVTETMILFWDNGSVTPNINLWKKIAETYGVTTAQLFSAIVETRMDYVRWCREKGLAV